MWLFILCTQLCFQVTFSHSAEKDNAPNTDIKAYKERYWAQGENTEIEVVQSRVYTKSKRIEVSLNAGYISSDPFLDVKTLGGSFGFHFNDSFALHLIGWKDLVSPSSALKTFEKTMGATTNYNAPKYYYGIEASYAILYGKISLLGKKIMYYDFYTLGGLGITKTESGTSVTPCLGVGQRFHLNKTLSLKFEYRAQRYNETIQERVITSKFGQNIGERTNWSNSFQIGIGVLFDTK